MKLKFECIYVGCDRYNQHTFGISKNEHEILRQILMNNMPEDTVIPLNMYSYGNTYYYNI